MPAAVIAHALVAAHAERARELARLYDQLERAVVVAGPDGAAARDAHREVSARITDWNGIDMEAERRDVVTIEAAERDEMLRVVRRAIGHVESYLADLAPSAPQHEVVASLRRIQTAFPTSLPRADLVRFRRSATRFETLEKLRVPAIIVGNEAGLMLGALERGATPIPSPDPDFDPGSDFGDTLLWGLHACLICEPGASGGVDLGLGTSPAVAALLGATGQDRYPFVPRGRFCAVDATGPVRGELESSGPIGWAAGADVLALARDLDGLAAEQPALAGELRAAAERVVAAARRGHAVIGLIESLPPEAEGHRTSLVDPDGAG